VDAETARVEHLKVIQAVVDRMGRNSFIIKTGSFTVVAALLAVTLTTNSWKVAAIGTIPIAVLWGLDAFFVRYERIFRCLYDIARIGAAPEIGSADYFSMDTKLAQSKVSGLLTTMISRTLPFFYTPLVGILIIVSLIN
jgi:hypothetical protein